MEVSGQLHAPAALPPGLLNLMDEMGEACCTYEENGVCLQILIKKPQWWSRVQFPAV
jgi:hypothetical protein